MAYHQITLFERVLIQDYLRQGKSAGDIAMQLGRHRSTIYREVERNCSRTDGSYRFQQADSAAYARRSRSRRNRRLTDQDWDLVEALLKQEHWSPEQIAGRMALEGRLQICHETIYRHVWNDKRRGGTLHTHLRQATKQRRKRHGTYDSRGRLAGKRPIGERPAAADNRSSVGHWEADTVLGDGKPCVVTLVERKTGYVEIGKLNARTSEELSRRTIQLILRQPKAVRTITADNGHFGCSCFHPLFCFNQFGDCEGVLLRSGNVHSADRWKEVLQPIVKRYENKKNRKYFRGDAAFAKPEIYEYLEGNGLLYAIRMPANELLHEKIRHLLTRPLGRPPEKPIICCSEFSYQAGSWDRPRRVVAKVEWHQGELFPRVGFIVTNMSAKPEGVVHFYHGRGTAEQWIKEGKYALHWTRLSCKRFVSNQVRLGLFVLAYNLGNFLRRLVLPRKIKHWSLRSLLVKLIKIGAKVVRHNRYTTFQMAAVAIDQTLFAEILARIKRLR